MSSETLRYLLSDWKALKIELARRHLYDFCELKHPQLYTGKEHAVELCDTLERLYFGLPQEDGKVYKKLIINYPPQHLKTITLTNFCQWVFGLNQQERIIQCSYSDWAATEFSRYVRDGMMEKKNMDEVVYSDIFTAKQKEGDKGVQKWALEGEHFNFLSAGVGGGITGKGATILIVDDPVKGAEEALNETHLSKIWLWYEGTFKSRVSAKGGEPLEIVNHTRWNKNDIAGRILANNDGSWYVLKRPAYNKDTDSMLCEDFLNRKTYEERKISSFRDNNTKMIFLANYQQEVIDIAGALYQNLKTYKDIPRDDNGNSLLEVKVYIDTADEGEDFLCAIVYGKYRQERYILDVYYTTDANEITEIEVAKLLIRNDAKTVDIESNAGGRAFARNVQRIVDENQYHCSVKWFHQSKNKQQRINSNSSNVQQYILFPDNWMDRWQKFYEDVTSYQRVGKNKHDDAPDALTGIIEKNIRVAFAVA